MFERSEFRSVRRMTGYYTRPVLIMALDAYLDDGGNLGEDDPYFILVSMAGPGDAWEGLEEKWYDILAHHNAPLHNGRPYMHAREAFKNIGGYMNWDDDPGRPRVIAMVRDLFDKAILPNGFCGESSSRHILTASCAIRLKDHRRVQGQMPNLRDYYRISTEWCFFWTYQYAHYRKDKFQEDIKIVPFLGEQSKTSPTGMARGSSQTYKMIEKLRVGTYGDPEWMLSTLDRPIVKDMREVAALQASDLIAWTINRYYGTKREHLQHPASNWAQECGFRMNIGARPYHIRFDEAELLHCFDGDGSTMREGAKIRMSPFKFGKDFPFFP